MLCFYATLLGKLIDCKLFYVDGLEHSMYVFSYFSSCNVMGPCEKHTLYVGSDYIKSIIKTPFISL